MGEMSTIYSTATVCLLDDPLNCQTLEPGTVLIRSRYGDMAAVCDSDKAVYNQHSHKCLFLKLF